MKKHYSKNIALCGLMSALAVVIMCLGGLIPVATYVCPVLCTLLGSVILKLCGMKLAWAWYGSVYILSLLLSPDKEAAMIYGVLGFYPYIKQYLDGIKFGLLLKLIYFNGVILLVYSFMLWIMGLTELLNEFDQIGVVGLMVVVVLGNVTFFLLDKLLSRGINLRGRHR